MEYIEFNKQDGIGVIRLNDPADRVNTLKAGMMAEFAEVIESLAADRELLALVLISDKPDCFVAGADIEMFAKFSEPGAAAKISGEGQALLGRLESLRVPVVAAIRGACLGGGLELALACHYRVAADDPKTVFGLPEVKLGLLPGLGGTQRLPRRVGLRAALDMMLTGKNVYAHRARKIGLVDVLIHPHGLEQAALAFARQVAGKPFVRRGRRGLLGWFLEATPPGRSIVYRAAARQVGRQTAGNYPAPPKIIQCVRTGLAQGMTRGLAVEARAFDELVRSPESRALVNLFFGMTATRKNPHAAEAVAVAELGVLGAGLMGAGIAEVSARKGYRVILKDVTGEALARGEQAIWTSLSKMVSRRIMSAFERDRLTSMVLGTTAYADLGRCQMVIEAVFEDLDLKRRVLADVEAVTPERCIFASNTSSLPIGRIAEGARRPGQVIGMHYFSPVPKMPLLEIIVTPQTESWVTATAVQVGIRQGKNVIVVKDGPGFYTTRILAPLMNEAVCLLEEGAAIEDVDRAMWRFGFPVGPVTLMDEVGLDVAAHVGEVLGDLVRARGVVPSETIARLHAAGFAGRKNKKGFYQYPAGKRKTVNQAIYAYFGGPARKRFDETHIQDRLSLVMINEAAYCLQEEVIRSPGDGDLGAILGLGFPPFLGGPFRTIDHLGAGKLLEKMERLASTFGARFEPAGILRDHLNRKFYD